MFQLVYMYCSRFCQLFVVLCVHVHYYICCVCLLESEDILRKISSSTFLSLSVSPDLSKVAVLTSIRQTIIVNLHDYFKHFPNHYPRVVNTKSPLHRGSQAKISQQSERAGLEEEDELLKYGGLSKRQKALGTSHHGRFYGDYSIQRNRERLRERVNIKQQGLNKDGLVNDSNNATLKWYKQRERDSGDTSDSIRGTPSAHLVSSFGRRGSVTPSISKTKSHSRKPSYINQTSNWSSFNYNCILPSPVTTTPASDILDSVSIDESPHCSLVYMECTNSMVMGYYCDTDYQSDYWSTGCNMEQSIAYIAVYNLMEHTYLVVK